MDRTEAYRHVCDSYGVDLDDNYSGAEDAQLHLDGEEPIERYCVVTESGEWVYAYPTAKSIPDALAKAKLYIGDSLFAETPQAIVDLDTGETLEPDWDAVPFKPGEPLKGLVQS